MFKGVIAAGSRKVITSLIPLFPPRVHILCSGNFTVETMLSLNGYNGRLSSCDVSLYTCALGWFLSGQDFRLEANCEAFPGVTRPLALRLTQSQDPAAKAAAVALSLDMLDLYKPGNSYYDRQIAAYVRRLDDLFEKTCTGFNEQKKALLPIDFRAQDAWERIGEIPAGEMIITFPPTYDKGYERLYKKLNQAFSWDAPHYQELTSGTQFLERIVAHDGPWMTLADKREQDYEELAGDPIGEISQGRAKTVWIYSNVQRHYPRLIRNKSNDEQLKIAPLNQETRIDKKSKIWSLAIRLNCALSTPRRSRRRRSTPAISIKQPSISLSKTSRMMASSRPSRWFIRIRPATSRSSAAIIGWRRRSRLDWKKS